MFGKTPDGAYCPLVKGPCVQAKCAWWTHLYGKDPQSEKVIDKFGCAIVFLPVLLVEIAQMERQTGAAVESARNEQVKMGQAVVHAALAQATAAIMNGPLAGPAKALEADATDRG